MLFIDGVADVEFVLMDEGFGIAVAQCLITAVVSSWRQVVGETAAQEDGLVEYLSVTTEQHHQRPAPLAIRGAADHIGRAVGQVAGTLLGTGIGDVGLYGL